MMTLTNTTRTALSHRRISLAGLLRAFSVWKQRQDLSRLDTTLLKDIGVTPDQAKTESRRPIWDAPEIWRC